MDLNEWSLPLSPYYYSEMEYRYRILTNESRFIFKESGQTYGWAQTHDYSKDLRDIQNRID